MGRFEEKAEKIKNTCFGYLISKNLVLRIFQKNHLAQMIGPIVLYAHAKNWEDTWSWLGEKNKKSQKTPFLVNLITYDLELIFFIKTIWHK